VVDAFQAIFVNRFKGACAVGSPCVIAEIDVIVLRKLGNNLPEYGKTTVSGVKYADRAWFHIRRKDKNNLSDIEPYAETEDLLELYPRLADRFAFLLYENVIVIDKCGGKVRADHVV